jgi:general secretion pathway protein D
MKRSRHWGSLPSGLRLAKLALAERFIHAVDTAQPEVVIQVSVLQVRRDRLRQLGISPDTSASLTFTPRAFSNSSKSSANATLPLNELKHLSGADYSVQLPGVTAQALLSDSSTQIIQDPQIRILDGQAAKLRIGDRVPVATGSFQAGVGAGSSGVSPLVNTQFTYIDVGVIVDVTPRIHPSGDVSIKVSVEVSSVTGHVTIGSIDQPIISQRKIEHDVRLKDREVNILGACLIVPKQAPCPAGLASPKSPFSGTFSPATPPKDRKTRF